MIPEKGNVPFQNHLDKCFQANSKYQEMDIEDTVFLLKANVQTQEIAAEKWKGVSKRLIHSFLFFF